MGLVVGFEVNKFIENNCKFNAIKTDMFEYKDTILTSPNKTKVLVIPVRHIKLKNHANCKINSDG